MAGQRPLTTNPTSGAGPGVVGGAIQDNSSEVIPSPQSVKQLFQKQRDATKKRQASGHGRAVDKNRADDLDEGDSDH